MDFNELCKEIKGMTREQKSALMWALFYDAAAHYRENEEKYNHLLTDSPQPRFGVKGDSYDIFSLQH